MKPDPNLPWLEDRYTQLCATPSAINEHLPLLRSLASECLVVVEFGTWHCHSTTALVLGTPGYVVSFDHLLWNCDSIKVSIAEFEQHAGNKFLFTEASTTWPNLFPTCDMLFIDTKHSYEQLSAELALYGNCATRYLVFHDTVTFGTIGDDGRVGLLKAIYEFMTENLHWHLIRDDQNNNGLLVLKRM